MGHMLDVRPSSCEFFAIKGKWNGGRGGANGDGERRAVLLYIQGGEIDFRYVALTVATAIDNLARHRASNVSLIISACVGHHDLGSHLGSPLHVETA
jgi:hypothetical protein